MTDAYRSLAVAVGATILASAGVARANVSFTMDGVWCRPETGHYPSSMSPSDDTRLTYQGSGGYTMVTNTSSGDAKVHCPIVKYASGPSITDDKLLSVDVVFGGSPSGSSCNVKIMKMSDAPSWGNNPPLPLDSGTTGTVGSPGPYTAYTGGASTPTNYWGDSHTWSFAEMICTLKPSASLAYYSVLESGTAQGKLIFPTSMCNPLSDGTGAYIRHAGNGTTLESVAYNGGAFHFTCPLFPNGQGQTQIMVGPSISSGGSAQLYCYSDGGWQLASQNSPAYDYPARVLTYSRANSSYLTSSVDCSLWDTTSWYMTYQGDAKIISYKTFP